MNSLTIIQQIAIWSLPVIFAITVHEAAHGWVASILGDKTAKLQGRVTLNPIKHIDPLGTIILPLVMLIMGTGMIFGWAKPVMVNTRNFKNPSKDMAIVAMAGPLSNLIMAIIWAFILKLGLVLGSSISEVSSFLIYTGTAGIIINLILLVLNLIPIPPLDGSKVLSAFLHPKYAYKYNLIEPYGFFILIGMALLGLLTVIISGPYNVLYDLIRNLIGI